MDKRTFKQMAEDYPDRREYFLDLHEQFERNNEREQEAQKGYTALGLSKDDIDDYIRLPRKFLKLLQWYLETGTRDTASIEKERVLKVLKTLFDIQK